VRTTRVILGVLFFATQALGNRVTRGGDVSIDDALSIIAGFDEEVSVTRYSVQATSGKLVNVEAPYVIDDPSPGMSYSQVLFDGASRRFNISTHSISKAVTGSSSAVSEEKVFHQQRQYASDGKVFGTWYSGELHNLGDLDGGNEFTDLTKVPVRLGEISEAIIAPSNDEVKHVQGLGVLAVFGSQAGVVWMPPYWWPYFSTAQPLSMFLRDRFDAGVAIDISLEEPKLWHVFVPMPNHEKTPHNLHLYYDLEKGRVVKARWTSTSEGGLEQDFLRFIPKWVKVDNSWVPSSVHLIYTNGVPQADRWEYNVAEINPGVDASDFHVDIPAGIAVTDYINKSYYTIGRTAADDDAAVLAFMERNELGADAAGSDSERRGESKWGGYLLWANVAVVLFVGVVLLIRRIRNRSHPVEQ
jgi:hypothetical protein